MLLLCRAADAATVTGTITKVVLASSVVAVMWDWHERGADHVYTEADWTSDSSVALNTYAFCKRESERLALFMAQQQHSWELAVVNPGIVFGPVATKALAGSLSIFSPIVQHLNGDRCVAGVPSLCCCTAARGQHASASAMQSMHARTCGCRYPYTSNIFISHVDVDDVAAAMCGLLATPGATGRCVGACKLCAVACVLAAWC